MSEKTAAKAARVSRKKLVYKDLENGLKIVDIAVKYKINERTVYRWYKEYLNSNYIFDIISDVQRLSQKVEGKKPEIVLQVKAKIAGDYFKEQNRQAPAVTVNVNNSLPDQMRIQINELFDISEQTCSDHPATTQKNTHCSDMKPQEANKLL